ncbi:hypothetical protein AURDEDRAFT_168920 [Auricularia subglabra TFB-10046 SS5]|nr:hypothetical protein AURDEDRAFT_168920 [Auricularia subglabra TFB-10046 SS5]
MSLDDHSLTPSLPLPMPPANPFSTTLLPPPITSPPLPAQAARALSPALATQPTSTIPISPSGSALAPVPTMSSRFPAWPAFPLSPVVPAQPGPTPALPECSVPSALTASSRSPTSTAPSVRGGYAIRGSELHCKAEVLPMSADDEEYYVCLPYISRQLYQDNIIKENLDAMIVEIEQVMDARSPTLDKDGFVSYDADEPDLTEKTAEPLSRNCMVRIRNYKGSRLLDWTDAHKIAQSGTIVTPHYTPTSLKG